MIPRCSTCNCLAGTSRTVAGKRMWCTAHISRPVNAASATTADHVQPGVGHYINNESTAAPGLHLESDTQKG